MLSIRLGRIGTKNKAFYRLIICEKGRDNYGNNLEVLGTYNPYTKELIIEEEKIKTWMSKGAKLSPTLNNLFIDKKVVLGATVKKQKSRRINTEKILKKREDVKKKEADAKAAAEAAAAKAAEEAAAAKAAAEAAAAEAAAAPVAEVAAETLVATEPQA
jgi:small subunit ribosomal protein S16